jgi:hypothetical protein
MVLILTLNNMKTTAQIQTLAAIADQFNTMEGGTQCPARVWQGGRLVFTETVLDINPRTVQSLSVNFSIKETNNINVN